MKANSRRPSAVVVVAMMLALIGIGSVILQREIASTVTAALLLSIAWAGLIGIAFVLYGRVHDMLGPIVAGLAVGAVIAGGSYYWFSVRDDTVDEDVIVATEEAKGAAAEQALAAGTGDGREAAAPAPAPANLTLATGAFSGEDGHDGSGKAAVVQQASGERKLTFTDFDVDPGAAVEVWLTTGPNETADRIDLGGLKGNVGDQQYEVPADADLNRYGTVVLYCTPFTVRIAVAPLKPPA